MMKVWKRSLVPALVLFGTFSDQCSQLDLSYFYPNQASDYRVSGCMYLPQVDVLIYWCKCRSAVSVIISLGSSKAWNEFYMNWSTCSYNHQNGQIVWYRGGAPGRPSSTLLMLSLSGVNTSPHSVDDLEWFLSMIMVLMEGKKRNGLNSLKILNELLPMYMMIHCWVWVLGEPTELN